tara:strand:+ start:624 stop:785 length:162 start_codon:yes stop_codon:yes gene_type:complete
MKDLQEMYLLMLMNINNKNKNFVNDTSDVAKVLQWLQEYKKINDKKKFINLWK